MNTIVCYTLQDKNDLCAILNRNGYVATSYNIVSMTENTCCGKQWRIDYYNPKEEQGKHIEQLEKENAYLNRDKTELVNSVTELKIRVTELENQ